MSKTREQEIQDLMAQTCMTRERAEFVLAIEAGEIDGDLIEVDDATSDEDD